METAIMTLADIVAEAIATEQGEQVEDYHRQDAAAVLARLAPLLRAAHWACKDVDTDDFNATTEFGVTPDLLAALNTWNEEQWWSSSSRQPSSFPSPGWCGVTTTDRTNVDVGFDALYAFWRQVDDTTTREDVQAVLDAIDPRLADLTPDDVRMIFRRVGWLMRNDPGTQAYWQKLSSRGWQALAAEKETT
jgi:hypothetical protein